MSVAHAEHTGPWTVNDVLALPEDPRTRVELVGGSLMMSPAPGVPHQRASLKLARFLEEAAAAADAPVEILEGVNVVVPDGLLIPDLVVVDADAAENASVTLSAPDVLAVIEIASPSTRVADRSLKPSLYAAAGIAHYWRVELEPVTRLYANALERGTYVQTSVATEKTTLHIGFPVTLNPAALTRQRR